MSKQTAVEWLKSEVLSLFPSSQLVELFEEAKAMEREQIEQAFRQGELFSSDYYDGKNINSQYYEITYKGGEQ